MMLSLLFAAALSGAPITADAVQTPAPAAADQQTPIALEDVLVTGRPLDNMIRDFVREVGEPNKGRGLARWEDAVCVGVVNLRREAAEYIADRVSTVAEDLGLDVGRPGCSPNVLIVAASEGSAAAQRLTEGRRRAFRMGGAGMDRGGDAFREFQNDDRAVRWWQMAMPVSAETGARAVALPGECTGACAGTLDYAPQIASTSASRLRTQIVDNLFRTIVVVDVDRLNGVSVQQLSDYIAMVTLAQIDPDADTSAYATILNVFDDPQASDRLTSWDMAYLQGLYDAERGAEGAGAGRSEISRSIRRAHQDLRAAEGTR